MATERTTAAPLDPRSRAQFNFLETVLPGEMLTLAGVQTPVEFRGIVADGVHGVAAEVRSSEGLFAPEDLQISKAQGLFVGIDHATGGAIYRVPLAAARFERLASPSDADSSYP